MKKLKKIFRELAHRFYPFMGWIGELRNPQTLRADVIAGITVALVIVPQSMAYAQLAGLPPYYGLYASFLPVMVAALFGSSRQLATGPVAIVSLLTASAMEPLAVIDPQGYLVYALVLALMVGVFQISLGLLRLGVLVDFLSHPVVTGFTNAAAIIIATSQLDKLFGILPVKGEKHYETVWNTLQAAVHSTHLPTLLIGILALTIMILLRRFAPRLPSVLVAVAVTTTIAWWTDFSASGGKIVGQIPDGLPGLRVPVFDPLVMFDLITVAIVIALIGFVEAISVAKAIAASTRQRLDANQELVGQGLANLTAGFFQGYSVSGSFSRSAVNSSAGAITGFSSVITSLVVGVTLLWLTPLLYHFPQATLAAVIIMAVINLIKIKPIKYAWKVQRHDGIIAVVTFLSTLIWAPHLDRGIFLGVILSLGMYMFRTMRPNIALLARHPDGTLRDAEAHILQTCPNISIIRLDGPLIFANTGYFETKILDRVATKQELKFIIIDAESINEIDATGEEMLHELSRRLGEHKIELLFARVKRPLMDVFLRTGFAGPEWIDHFFRTRTQAMEYAWDRLGDDHELTCPLNMVCLIEPDNLEKKSDVTPAMVTIDSRV